MKPIVAGLFVIACCVRTASGAYILDGNRSAVGAYAYLDEYTTDFSPPPANTAFHGDVRKQICGFHDGALMDAVGESLGCSVGFPHNSRDT
jgi:hypothetical protein